MMQPKISAAQKNDTRPELANGWKVAAWLVGSIFVGALVAPHVFNALTALGRKYASLEGLRGLEFESVAGRCVLVCLLLALYPALRHTGIRTRADLGYPTGRWADWRSGLSVGFLSLGIMFTLAWITGAYQVVHDDRFSSISKWLSIIAGALLIGFIEECLFRGLLFKAFRRIGGFGIAAVGSSLLFSLVHFAAPTPADGTIYGHWNEGLKLFAHLFDMGKPFDHYVPFSITLFIMGMLLCRISADKGTLYFAAGLHTGWVIMMRGGIYLFERDPSVLPWLYGRSDIISKSWAATVMALFLWALYSRPKRPRRNTPS